MYAGVIVWPKHIGPPNLIEFEKLTRIPYVCYLQMASSNTVWYSPKNSSHICYPSNRGPLRASALLFLRKFSYCKPKPLLTPSLTTFSNSSLRSRHIIAASTFAGLSSFGSANILITLIRIISVDWIGLHRSLALS